MSDNKTFHNVAFWFLGILVLVGIASIFQFFAPITERVVGKNVAAVSATSPVTLYNGESVNLSASCLTYASEVSGAGNNGTNGLKLTPDKYHTSTIRLYCGGSARRNFSIYGYLQFYVKSGSGSIFSKLLWVDTFSPSSLYSNKIDIVSYTDGGVIDGTWRKVRIPISALQTATWNLGAVETIFFDTDSLNRILFVDDVTLETGATTSQTQTTTSYTGNVYGGNTYTGTSYTAGAPTTNTTNTTITTDTSKTALSLGAPATIDVTKKGILLWNGEQTVAVTPTNFLQGSPVTTNVYEGTYTFEGIPTQYYPPTIVLKDQPMFRKSIEKFDEIWFYAKTDTPGKTINFSIYTYNPSTRVSNTVNISQYIEGGVLDTTYRLVRIPLSALKTATYPIDSIDGFRFGTANPSGYKIYIDNMWAVDLSPISVTGVKVLSNGVLKLSLSGRFDMAEALNASNYSLTSSNDSAFATGVNPIQVGRHYYPVDLVNSCNAVINYEVFLVFNSKMNKGSAYTLTVNNVRDFYLNDFVSPQNLAFIYDDSLVNGSVKANQVGYLVDSPKYAYAGNYLGDAGAMSITAPTCQVVNASTNSVVASPSLTFRGSDPTLSGENVYSCDFSSVTAPGTYFVYIPTVGKTYNFRIGNDVMDDPFYKTARLFYYQRAGIALDSAHAGIWARPAGHSIEDAVAQIAPSQTASPLYGGEVVGSTVNLLRGWYDAGDYGKYVATAGPTLFHLFTAYELFPQKFIDNQLNIPESGNGVPDLLDEIKWEVDWLKNMQAPDGGVYFKVVTTPWAVTVPQDDHNTRYIAEKTTQSTGIYVATLAMAYRNFKGNARFEALYPGYADDLLARAKKSWTYLEAHQTVAPFSASGVNVNPPGIGGGGYGDPLGDADERAWASAELYKTTGDTQYSSAFVKYWTQHTPTWGWNEFQHQQLKASWAYATTKFPTDASYITSYKTAFKRDIADITVTRTNNNFYRNGYRSDVRNFIGWGSFAQSGRTAWNLIMASYLFGDNSYITSAKINLDTELGNNPQYKTYISGVGYDYPKDPLQGQSMFDTLSEPVPGVPVYGPTGGMSNGILCQAVAQNHDTLYPPGANETEAYPTLRKYFDIREVVAMSEFTIEEMAPIVASFGYFNSASSGVIPVLPPPPPSVNSLPTVTISATDANASEPGVNTGVFTLTRVGDTTSSLSVNLTISGSATNGADYSSIGNTATIPQGQTSATVTVTPIDDLLIESNETAVVTISANTAYTIGATNSATVTITDNDSSKVTLVPPDGTVIKTIDNFENATIGVLPAYQLWSWAQIYKDTASSLSVKEIVADNSFGVKALKITINSTMPWTTSAGANIDYYNLYLLGSPMLPPNADYVRMKVKVLSGTMIMNYGDSTVYFGDSDAGANYVTLSSSVNPDWQYIEFPLNHNLFRNYRRAGFSQNSPMIYFTRWAQETPALNFWRTSSGSMLIDDVELVNKGEGKPFPTFSSVTPVSLVADFESTTDMSKVFTFTHENTNTAVLPLVTNWPPATIARVSDASGGTYSLESRLKGQEEVSFTGIKAMGPSSANAVSFRMKVENTTPGDLGVEFIAYASPDLDRASFPWNSYATPTSAIGDPKAFNYYLSQQKTVGANYAMYHSRRLFQTGVWNTVTIPLKDFVAFYGQGTASGMRTNQTPLASNNVFALGFAPSYSQRGAETRIVIDSVSFVNVPETSSLQSYWQFPSISGLVLDKDTTYLSYGGVVHSNESGIASGGGGSGGGSITPPPSGTPTLPTVTISSTDSNASEPGVDRGVFTITRLGDTTSSLSVNLTISGSATNGADYSSIGNTATIPAGATTVNVTVTPIDDTIVEANETVIATIGGSANYTIGSANNATVVLADNDILTGPSNVTRNFDLESVKSLDSISFWDWNATNIANASTFSTVEISGADAYSGGHSLHLVVSQSLPWVRGTTNAPIDYYPITSISGEPLNWNVPPNADAVRMRVKVLSGSFIMSIGSDTIVSGGNSNTRTDDQVLTSTNGAWQTIEFSLNHNVARNFNFSAQTKIAPMIYYTRWVQNAPQIIISRPSYGEIYIDQIEFVMKNEGKVFANPVSTLVQNVADFESATDLTKVFTLTFQDVNFSGAIPSYVSGPTANGVVTMNINGSNQNWHIPSRLQIVSEGSAIGHSSLEVKKVWAEEVSATGIKIGGAYNANAIEINVKGDIPSALNNIPIDFYIYAVPSANVNSFFTPDYTPPVTWQSSPWLNYNYYIPMKLPTGGTTAYYYARTGATDTASFALYHARRFVPRGQWTRLTIPFADFVSAHGQGTMASSYSGQLSLSGANVAGIIFMKPHYPLPQEELRLLIDDVSLVNVSGTSDSLKSFWQIPNISAIQLIADTNYLTYGGIVRERESGITGGGSGGGSTTPPPPSGTPTLPTVTISSTDSNASEPGVDRGVFTITRLGDTTSSLSVNLTISGSATNGADYSSIGNTATIPAGATTVNVTVTPIDDTIVEANETVIATIGSNTNYTIGSANNATVVVSDNDVVTVSTPTNLSVALSGSNQANLSWTDTATNEIGFKIERKIGVTGVYAQINTTLANITTYVDSGLVAGNTYYYRVTAYNVSANSIYSNEVSVAVPVATVSTVSVIASGATASETSPDVGIFTFTRVGATTIELIVNYSLSGTAINGSDYWALAGSVIIPAGATTASVTISPIDDTVIEGAESVVVTILPSANYTIGAPINAVVNIVDNDSVSNKPPIVSAGIDKSVRLPNAMLLLGSASDDGLPNPPAKVTLLWQKVSGPGTVTFSNSANASTSASFGTYGTYILSLSANDGSQTVFDTMTATVGRAKSTRPPKVRAQASATTVSLSSPVITLTGTATPDLTASSFWKKMLAQVISVINPDPNADITVAWSMVSGPDQINFSSSNTETTNASFKTAGDYVIRFTGYDMDLSAEVDIPIKVTPAPNTSNTGGGSSSGGGGGSPSNGGGGGGGGGIIGGGGYIPVTNANTGNSYNYNNNNNLGNHPPTTGQVINSLPPIPNNYVGITLGQRGPTVTGLQKFLIEKGYLKPIYNTGYYGPITDTAVKKYEEDLKTPNVPPTNNTPPISNPVSGGTVIVPQGVSADSFSRTLAFGFSGEDVRSLQKFLNNNGYKVSESGIGSLGNESFYFGLATKKALIRFQNAYADKILAPAGLTQGTGYFGQSTMKVIKSLISQ